MKFSTKGRYALRLMVELSRHSAGKNISLKEISQAQDISLKYMEQIITPLTRAGLVKSGRGSQGGYRLARPAGEYTAGEILRAVEGDLAPIQCLEDEVNQCPHYANCSTVRFWAGLDKVIREYVDGVHLDELKSLNEEAALASGMTVDEFLEEAGMGSADRGIRLCSVKPRNGD